MYFFEDFCCIFPRSWKNATSEKAFQNERLFWKDEGEGNELKGGKRDGDLIVRRSLQLGVLCADHMRVGKL